MLLNSDELYAPTGAEIVEQSVKLMLLLDLCGQVRVRVGVRVGVRVRVRVRVGVRVGIRVRVSPGLTLTLTLTPTLTLDPCGQGLTLTLTLTLTPTLALDLCGQERFLKTTLYGLTAHAPDYALLVIAADAPIGPMARLHLRSP